MLFPNFVDFLIKLCFLECNKRLSDVDTILEKYLKNNLQMFHIASLKPKKTVNMESSESRSSLKSDSKKKLKKN